VHEDVVDHPAILPVVTNDDLERIARGYRSFGGVDAAEESPLYAQLAAAVADDEQLLRFLADLPAGKRQPMLLFATLQFLHGSPPPPDQMRSWILGDAERVRATMLTRATQTNEPARCAALLPVLARLPGPLALIEPGTSAGLCLYPDRYRYEYDGVQVGPQSPLTLRCTTSGPGPVPDRVPEVTARIGIDLNPLDPADEDDAAWLRALIWPGPHAADRLHRLAAATEIAAREPARVLRGDLVERLPEALDLVPQGSTAVVFHTALLIHVRRESRDRFVDLVRSRQVRWVAQEGFGALPDVDAQIPEDRRVGGRFVLSLDGRALAQTAPHGGRIDWLPAGSEIISS
jgi:hypothetical protein